MLPICSFPSSTSLEKQMAVFSGQHFPRHCPARHQRTADLLWMEVKVVRVCVGRYTYGSQQWNRQWRKRKNNPVIATSCFRHRGKDNLESQSLPENKQTNRPTAKYRRDRSEVPPSPSPLPSPAQVLKIQTVPCTSSWTVSCLLGDIRRLILKQTSKQHQQKKEELLFIAAVYIHISSLTQEDGLWLWKRLWLSPITTSYTVTRT